MSFRSNARSNVARYAQAGKAAANAGVQISGGIAKNRPRYDRIENERMTANAEQFRAAVRADAQVAEAGIKAKARIDITKTAIDRDKSIAASKKSARKAGMIAAGVGAIGGGLMMQNRKEEVNPMLKSYQDRIGYYDSKMSDYDKQITDQEALIGGMEAPEGYKPSSSGSSTSGSSGTSSTSNTSSSSTGSQLSSGSIFQQAADITGKFESDAYGGYNAFNTGGSNGGHTAHGSGNSSSNSPFGGALTSMTIGQLKSLQAQGKLHAAGRYQFIGNSLPEAAQFAGLSDNDTFSPGNQDRMFFAFGKKYGSGRWVGLDNASDQERSIVNQAFQQWQP